MSSPNPHANVCTDCTPDRFCWSGMSTCGKPAKSHDELHRLCLATDPDFDRRPFDEQTRIRDRVLIDEARFTRG